MRDYSARAMGFNPTEEKRRRTNLLSMALSIFAHAYDKNCPINEQEVARKYYCLGVADGWARGFTEGVEADVRDIKEQAQEQLIDVVEPGRSRKVIEL